MILRSLSQHWPARKIEWLMAALTFLWGFYILQHPEVFTQRQTSEILSNMVEMAAIYGLKPETFWGWGAFSMGLIRATALFVNGAYVRTPIFRMIAAFGSMFIFTQVSIALYRSGVPNFGIVVYPWLVFADLLSAYRAAQDAVFAEVQRRSQKDATGAATYPCLHAA